MRKYRINPFTFIVLFKYKDNIKMKDKEGNIFQPFYIIEESKCNLIFNIDIIPKKTLIKTYTHAHLLTYLLFKLISRMFLYSPIEIYYSILLSITNNFILRYAYILSFSSTLYTYTKTYTYTYNTLYTYNKVYMFTESTEMSLGEINRKEG